MGRGEELAPEPNSVVGDSSQRNFHSKTFVITGILPTLSRDQASELIRDTGGNVTGAVSKNTDCLLAGENAGAKLDRAHELNVRVISESEFLELLENGNLSKSEPAQGSLFEQPRS